MSVSVRKASERDAHKVYDLLRSSPLQSAGLPFEARKRMFQPIWKGSQGYYGYVVEDGDAVVGFLGLLFTEREIRGSEHKFCELHSWYVKDGYRNESIKLFLAAMSVRNATFLNYTPTNEVYEISKKFGFNDLESKVLLLLPIPTRKSLGARPRVEYKKAAIAQHLDEVDRRIFHDHENLDCEHFVIKAGQGTEYSYVILKKMKGKEADVLPDGWNRYEPFGRILYASNRQIILDNIDYLKLYWCLRYRLKCILIDHDELDGKEDLSFTKVVPRDIPSLYKSKELKPEDIRPPLYALPLLIGYGIY